MANINRAFGNQRLMKALTGMPKEEFKQLSIAFGKESEKRKQSTYKKGIKKGTRYRKPGGGKKGRLKTYEQKLFFILFYFKCYPTFDLLGFMFDLNRSNSLRNIQRATPILEQTLGRKLVLPKRQIRTPEELFSLFPKLHDIFVDGTERPMQRPKDKDKQKSNYSGKKKRHTRKNTIISDKNKRIVYLGPTAEGKKHDYSMFKDEIPMDIKSKKHNFWMDLGYTGAENDYPKINIVMPKKKPKGKELTENEKENNQIISGFRVNAEHAIGGIKRLRITTDVFRNKKDKFNDVAIMIACGLWNYHLGYK